MLTLRMATLTLLNFSRHVSAIASCRLPKPKQLNNQNQSWLVWELQTIVATIFTLNFRTKMRVEVYIDRDLTTHSMILDSISRRFIVWNLRNSFPAGSFPRENWIHYFSFFSTALSILLISTGAQPPCILWTNHVAANVDAILFFSNGKFDVIT